MLRNTFARLRTVRVRITIIATVLTGVALTVSAVLLVSAVEHRLESQVRADTRLAAAKVAGAVQAGQSFQQAVLQPAPGVLVYIVGDTGDVLATSSAGVAGAGTFGPLPDTRLLNGSGRRARKSLPRRGTGSAK